MIRMARNEGPEKIHASVIQFRRKPELGHSVEGTKFLALFSGIP